MFLRTALFASALALSAVAGAPAARADETGSLRIELSGLAPQGNIMLQVFNSEAGYGSGEGVTARRIAVDAATESVQIDGLAPGQYAVRLFHDVDGNGELNTNPFGIPTEPFAFSNNARGRFGPATWEQAAFTLNAGDNVQAIAVGGQWAMSLSRRSLLSAFAAAGAMAAAGPALATEPQTAWSPGLDNAPAEGFNEAVMRLVHGRAPRGLEGTHFRNGPGWFRYADTATGHWFDGDGFIQRFAVADGGATHAGRFVDTPKRRMEQREQRIIAPGFGTRGAPDAPVQGPDDVNAANTSVMIVGDELWALWEGGSPTRLDPRSLHTIGFNTFRADLAGMPFLAHPKVEPNGRIWNLGVSGNRAMVWRLSADGALEDAQVIPLPSRSYIHDWAVTERHLIIPLQPWLHQRMVAPIVDGFEWRGDQPFRVMVLDKNDYSNQRIYDLPAMFFFHTGDAWEDADGTIRFDLCVTPDAQFVSQDARAMINSQVPQGASAELVMAVLHADGRAELQRSGQRGEFPQTDRRRQGQSRDLVAMVDDRADNRIRVMNWRSGAYQSYAFGADQMVQEHLFVPKPGRSGEHESWLIGATLNARENATELHVFDAAAVGDGPVATWRSRYRAPLGFHSTWRGA